MTQRLAGRRAVVTGGGRGIGRAFVERFLDEGASVAILDLDTDSAARTARDLADRATVPVIRTNVSDQESVQAGVDAAAAALGGIDILVNNAALFAEWRQHDHSFENLKRMFDVNLLSLWLVTAAAAPHLVKSEHGRGHPLPSPPLPTCRRRPPSTSATAAAPMSSPGCTPSATSGPSTG